MTVETLKTALKEWAVGVRALDQGRQVILLRKGGIREPGKEFRVPHQEFLLYPTYEHQRAELLKEECHPILHQTLEEWEGESVVVLSHFARVEEVFEVAEQEAVDALAPYYVYTTDYAQKRLHWKPRKPLSIILARVYRLVQPQALPVFPQYAGCTSWVELVEAVPLQEYTPVLTDAAFRQQAEGVRAALARTRTPAS